MAQFSASDAAFEGFRLTREQPRAVLVWAGLIFLVSLISSALTVSLAGEALTQISALGRAGEAAAPPELFARLRGLLPIAALALPLSVLFYGVLYSAVNRAILRPREGGLGFLKLGSDELKQAAALLLVCLLLLGVYIGLVLAAVLLGVVGGSAGGVTGGIIGGIAAFFLLVAGLAFFLVRFSLASPLTFGRGRIQVLQSWGVTKGYFWPLLGAFVLAGVLVIVVYLLGMMIFSALAALAGGGIGAIGQAFAPNYASLGEYFTLPVVLYLAVSSILAALSTAIMGGTAASAYRQITGEDAGVAETFA